MAERLTSPLWAPQDGSAPDGEGYPARAFDLTDEFFPGDPIGGSPQRRSRLGTVVFLILLPAAGIGAMQTYDVWSPWVATIKDGIIVEVERSKPQVESASQPAPTAPEPLPSAKDVAQVAGTALNPPGTEPVVSANEQDPTSTAPLANPQNPDPPTAEPRPVPLPEIQVDISDPYQKRAAAIGLHPQLSRALLSSLSDADFRNAGIAIRTALARTSDGEKYIWPKLPKPQAAVFQVHFVTGDRTDCRRYVVTVLKNGWTTTAPPMEKCGIATPKHSADARHVERLRRSM